MPFTAAPIERSLINRTRSTAPGLRSRCLRVAANLNRVFAKIKGRNEIQQNNPLPSTHRFRLIADRLKLLKEYAPSITPKTPYGVFRGRPVIAEHTRIQSGIFLTIPAREALVVDPDDGELQTIYLILQARILDLDGELRNDPSLIIDETFRLVRKTIRFSEEAVRRKIRKLRIFPDEKVGLGVFVKNRIGVARHRVLLAAYLLERLLDDGVIQGTMTISSEIFPEDRHEKLLFFHLSGDVFRFDPLAALGTTALH